VDIAVDLLQAGEPYVDLQPAVAHIRRRQHELARDYGLISQSFGKDPNRYVRIYRD
jgi:predicted RNA-binding protein Jag